MRNTRYLVTATFLLLGTSAASAAPAKNPIVCVAKKNGSIEVKSKCTKSESRLAESGYSEGRTTILNVAAKGAKFSSITSALGAAKTINPSATNPVLIKLAPGRYTVEDPLTIPSFITLEGAGTGTSIVSVKGTGLLAPESSSIIRRMTIEVTGQIEAATPLFIQDAASDVRIEDVDFTNSTAGPLLQFILSRGTNVLLQRLTFRCLPPSSGASGIAVPAGSASIAQVRMNLAGNVTGVSAFGGTTVTVRDSTVNVAKIGNLDSALGIRATNSGTTLELDNVNVTALGDGGFGIIALWSTDGPRLIARNSSFSTTGTTYGTGQVDESGTLEILSSDIKAEGANPPAGAFSGGSLSIGGSRLSGGSVVTQTGGTARCAAVYDEDFVFSASTCP